MSKSIKRVSLLSLALVAFAGCSGDATPPAADAGALDASMSSADAAVAVDADVSVDAAVAVDADVSVDAAVAVDADVSVDAAVAVDADVAADAAVVADAMADAFAPELSDCTSMGEVSLGSLIDVTSILFCHTVASLVVPDTSTLSVIDLPYLQHVNGNLQLRAPSLTSFTAAALEDVGGVSFVVIGTSLTTFELPSLVRAFGTFSSITNNAELEAIRLPALAVMRDGGGAGIVSVTENPSLTTIELDALERGTLVVTDFEGTTLSFPNLETVSSFQIKESPNLVSVSVPLLTTVQTIVLSDNPSLTSFSAPMLESVTGDASATNNDLLCDFIDEELVEGTYTFEDGC